MKTFTDMWYIAMKDLKRFIMDRAYLFFFFVFPFMFIVLFNFLMAGVGTGDERLTLMVATREGPGGLSHQILQGMETPDAESLEPGQPRIVWIRDYEQAKADFDAGELNGFVAFPADFTAALMAGTPTELVVYASTDSVDTRAALNGLAGAIASQISAHGTVIEAGVRLMIESGTLPPDTASIDRFVEKVMADLFSQGDGTDAAAALTFRTEKVGEVEEENPANWVMPGYLVMFVFFAAAMSAESIVKERTNNTLERLLTTSVKKVSILGGTYLGMLIRGVLQIILFWMIGILAFDIDLGLSPGAVILLSILMVVMSCSFAVLLATITRTQRAAGSLANLVALILAPLGGCWWPLFLYPDWLQTIARVTPHAWAMSGFNKLMLFGSSFGDVVPEMLALVGFAAVFAVIGVFRFRASAI